MEQSLIIKAMVSPSVVMAMRPVEWDQLISEARRTNMLARLAVVLVTADILEKVPEAPRKHLRSALLMSKRQDAALRWELDCIRSELRRSDRPIILLKGAAYLAFGLPNAAGRMFGDIDILVPKENLALVEMELLVHGWQHAVTDAYDQRYYRQWMHEIPPLRHIVRNTVVDLHHSILPDTARVKVKISPMIQAAVPLGDSGLSVLSPEDMVLHSSAHLFHEGDFDNALRDLFDIKSLIEHFSSSSCFGEVFFERLIDRAAETRLARPLFYALRYQVLLLGTRIPSRAIEFSSRNKPLGIIRKVMDALYIRAFEPVESNSSLSIRFARFCLYIRSHWIRMPVHLLSYHLIRKGFRSIGEHNN